MLSKIRPQWIHITIQWLSCMIIAYRVANGWPVHFIADVAIFSYVRPVWSMDRHFRQPEKCSKFSISKSVLATACEKT